VDAVGEEATKVFLKALNSGILRHRPETGSSSSSSAGRSSKKLHRGHGLAAAAERQNTIARPVVAAKAPAA
jgi:hypothetical protein